MGAGAGAFMYGIVGPMTVTASLLERKLLVVTGKGGVGKTTIAAALGPRCGRARPAHDRRRARRAAPAAGAAPGASTHTNGRQSKESEPGAETALGENLWGVTIDPDRALLEWLQALGGRVPGRVLASSGTFQYFAAAAPGAKELVSMVKVWELTCGSERWRRRAGRYDLVVLDAPATGHALGLLHSPRTFGAIARVGPIFGQAEKVRELLEDADADRLPGGRARERDGRRRDARAAGRAARAAGRAARRDDRQRDPATTVSTPRSSSGSRAWRAPARLPARRCWPHEPCTSARAYSTTRSRACGGTGMKVQTAPFVFTAELDLDAVRSIGRRLTGRA